MNQLLLLPPKSKSFGFLLIAAAASLYLLGGAGDERIQWYIDAPVIAYAEPFAVGQYLTMSRVAFYDTFFCLLFLIGMMCIAFARIKNEDEYISSLRLQAWLWAVLVNVGLACIGYLFFYGMSFFFVIAANLFSLLALFNLRFYYLLYKTSKLKSL